MILNDYINSGGAAASGVPLYGVEIELEGIPYMPNGTRALRRFQTVEDGSLRGASVELVSNPPMNKEALLQVLDGADNFVSQCRASLRTSVHIHVDARRFTPQQVASVVMMYALFERVFFEVSGDRSGNPFCMPLTSMDFLQRIQGAMSMWRRGSWAPLPPLDSLKYSAFNLGHLYGQGSIEFRHHAGVESVAPIKTWLNSIDAFVEWAASKDCERIVNVNPRLYAAWSRKVGEMFGTTVTSDYYDALLNLKAVI